MPTGALETHEWDEHVVFPDQTLLPSRVARTLAEHSACFSENLVHKVGSFEGMERVPTYFDFDLWAHRIQKEADIGERLRSISSRVEE